MSRLGIQTEFSFAGGPDGNSDLANFSCSYFMNLIRFVLHTEISIFETRIVPDLVLPPPSRRFIAGERVLDQFLGIGEQLRV